MLNPNSRLTIKSYTELAKVWCLYKQGYNAGLREFKCQRFGQWLINNYITRAWNKGWPELFYERDDNKAFKLAFEEIYILEDTKDEQD